MNYDGWIPMAAFCKKYEVRSNTVHKWVTDGFLKRGVHLSVPEGTHAFVHEERVVAWMRETKKL